jgi:hypothetical protein
MNEHGEHGPLPDPALGDASPSDDPPEPPVEREGAGTELARGEESERQTETPPG